MTLYHWSDDQDECVDLYGELLNEIPDYLRPSVGTTIGVFMAINIAIRAHTGSKKNDLSVIADLTKLAIENADNLQEDDL
jgi:hypothetical protein